tara:strand:+ start:526 stop:747 length:222 start_codon:yes stop_codon:yes gene_type:complete
LKISAENRKKDNIKTILWKNTGLNLSLKKNKINPNAIESNLYSTTLLISAPQLSLLAKNILIRKIIIINKKLA